jgi:hypothetical protein
LKALSGLTPYEFVCKRWTSEPDRFILDPIHQMPGPNTESVFEKPMRGSLSGEADGRAMIAKARIPPALTIAPMKSAASP